jgi:hypothetical protein
MPDKKKRFWLGPGRNPRGKGQMFEPVAFPTRRQANRVRKTGTSAGRVRREGGGNGGWILLLIVLAIIVALVLTACKPVDAGRGKPEKTTSEEAAPFVPAKPLHGSVYIAHRVGSESFTRLTVPRNPAGLFERNFIRTGTSPRTADILATRNFIGQLGCYIWYVNDGQVWLISYDESVHGGGVACALNDIIFQRARKGVAGRKIEDCDCTVGNDTIVMRVTWIPDGDHQEK